MSYLKMNINFTVYHLAVVSSFQ